MLPLLLLLGLSASAETIDLIRDSANIGTYTRDFFPPDFSDWRIYVREMIITLHIAVWGTLLAVIAAVPLGLLASANVAPPWIHQPVRRLMDAFRAINEMVFAMLFIVAVGLGGGVAQYWYTMSLRYAPSALIAPMLMSS